MFALGGGEINPFYRGPLGEEKGLGGQGVLRSSTQLMFPVSQLLKAVCFLIQYGKRSFGRKILMRRRKKEEQLVRPLGGAKT